MKFILHFSPIFTGNPAGNCNSMKSFSFAKWGLDMAIRSTMGRICSGSDRGYSSLNQRVALNFCTFMLHSLGRPISLPFISISASKYSSGVMLQGFVELTRISYRKHFYRDAFNITVCFTLS